MNGRNVDALLNGVNFGNFPEKELLLERAAHDDCFAHQAVVRTG
jgi:hypothetical protein